MTEPSVEPVVRRLLRVVLVDDHRLFRAGVRSEIGDRVDVVGEAGDVDEAIAVVRATRPDVVLLDVHLPGGGGRAVLDACADDLVDAVQRVADGDAVFSPRLAGFVLDAFSGGVVDEADDALDSLSPREREVMRLIARGYTYREVARDLVLSVKTVETHVSAVLRKLQLSNRHELAKWAAAHHVV